jgi:hypothetical protein
MRSTSLSKLSAALAIDINVANAAMDVTIQCYRSRRLSCNESTFIIDVASTAIDVASRDVVHCSTGRRQDNKFAALDVASAQPVDVAKAVLQ